jgi:hypothetical protein
MTPHLVKLIDLLSRLRNAKIHYRLNQVREEAIMVEIAVPGERWEVEFFGDGAVEIERFKSDGAIFGEEELAELFKKYSE